MIEAKRSSRWLTLAYEFLFSLNLVWIAVWHERVRQTNLGGRSIAYQVDRLVDSIQHLAPYLRASDIGGSTILVQMVWSLAVTIIVFLILRLLSGFPMTQSSLRAIGGVAAIAAFPIAALFFGVAYPDCCSGAYRIGLALETIILLICGAFFYLGKRSISPTLMIMALALHFAIWTWMTSSYVNIPAVVSNLRSSEYYHAWTRIIPTLSLDLVFHCGFPVFGFLAGLTWVRCLRRSSEGSTAVKS